MWASGRRWTLGFAVIVMVITSIPYLLGMQTQKYGNQNQRWIFSGFVFGVEDGNSYIAKMRLGYEGDWLFHTPYTAMEQSGLLAFLPYILLGKLAGAPALHEQFVLLFHWFRIGAGVLMIVASGDFISRFIKDKFLCRIGIIMVSLGGGLGWLMLFFPSHSNLPLEFYSPEGFGFLSLYGLPHLAMGRAFFLWTILEYLRLWEKVELNPNRFPWILSIFWFLSGIAQPMYPGVLGLMMGAHWVIYSILTGGLRKDHQFEKRLSVLRELVIAGLLPGSLLGYTAYKFIVDPYLKIWSVQNYLPSAPIGYYLASYGWLILLGVFGIKLLWKQNKSDGVLFSSWMVMVPILIFIPISIQRRLIEGYWVILVCLALFFISQTQKIKSLRRRYAAGLLLFILSLPTTIVLITGGIQKALVPAEPVFLPQEQVELFSVIEEIPLRDKPVVLASYRTSNALPAYASVKVLIGHGPESAYGDQLLKQVKLFYSMDALDEFRKQFLLEHKVRFLVWSESEREYGEWNPAAANYLRLLYGENDRYLYEVLLEEPAG